MEDAGVARVAALSEIDAELAERLAERLVDRFLAGAGLRTDRRAEAIAQVEIDVRLTSDGEPCGLDFALPLGAGHPGFLWDGSVQAAEAIADNAADGGIEDVLWDREHIGPTGWEPESDSPARGC